MRTIRIGNGAGYWGDNLDAPRRLALAGRLDYLTLEYLAELTLSILAHLRARDPAAGFVTDLPEVFRSLVPAVRDQAGLKIVTNGGGMNPHAAATAVARCFTEAGLAEVPIAAVAGDDILPRLAELMAAGEPFSHFDTGQPLAELANARGTGPSSATGGNPFGLASANVYLGAAGIVRALEAGARIVITGRVADASLTVGPAVHEFGWSWSDWQRLAQASVAGHLIECGAQATGGMFSDWSPALDMSHLGYPIVEMAESGEFTLGKPRGTGGCVSVETVSEQLVYEIGDPAHYLTPDVDVDFTEVTLREEQGPEGERVVRVRGARGNPAPERLKVSMSYRDGYMAAGTLVLCGDGAAARAEAAGRLILRRLDETGAAPARAAIEVLGTGDTWPGLWPGEADRRALAREVVLRVCVHDADKKKLERFVREFSPLAGSGPGGVTGYTGPRPQPYPIFAYWPSTIARERITHTVDVRTAAAWCGNPAS